MPSTRPSDSQNILQYHTWSFINDWAECDDVDEFLLLKSSKGLAALIFEDFALILDFGTAQLLLKDHRWSWCPLTPSNLSSSKQTMSSLGALSFLMSWGPHIPTVTVFVLKKFENLDVYAYLIAAYKQRKLTGTK